MHPSRLRFATFSDKNPMMQAVKGMAESIRADRKPVSSDNPLLSMEKVYSTWVSTCWESYRLARDAMTETMFMGVYGSPVMQAMVGMANGSLAHRRIERDLQHEVSEAHMRADLEKHFEVGGLPEAAIRSLIYIRLPQQAVDERGYAMLMAVRAMQPMNRRMSKSELKAALREQYMLLRLDEERAVAAIPRLLPDSEQARRAGLDAIRQVVKAPGALSAEGERRLDRIEKLFGEAPHA